MPGPRSGMKPIRDGSECGGIVHAADATFIPQASERPNVILSAILSTRIRAVNRTPMDLTKTHRRRGRFIDDKAIPGVVQHAP